MASNKIPQHVQIKPGRTCIRMRISPASLPRVETIHFDIWSLLSTQEQWFDLRERWHRQHWLSLCDSAVKVCYGTPMHWRAWHFPFEPALKLCEHSAAPATARRSSTIKRLASPNAPKSSLNSNSIRLLLCVFVSFRSHLAITGANLWSAPGYSVKMTDLSRLLLFPPPNPSTPPPPLLTPRSRGFATPGVPTLTGAWMP